MKSEVNAKQSKFKKNIPLYVLLLNCTPKVRQKKI